MVYSKAVEAASATNLANYAFTNGLPVTGATLNPDNQTVVFTTAPLVYGSNYWLVINGVRDRAATPNTIATNTTVAFTALPYTPQDLGNPAVRLHRRHRRERLQCDGRGHRLRGLFGPGKLLVPECQWQLRRSGALGRPEFVRHFRQGRFDGAGDFERQQPVRRRVCHAGDERLVF